jgi:UPF0716 protein FxsA
MALIPVLFILELAIGITMTNYFGFVNTALAYVIPTFLGLTFFSFQNQMIMMQFQKQVATGNAPDTELLTLVARFVSTVLLIIPSMIARAVALVLIFPLTRFAIIFFGRNWMARKISSGTFKVFGARPGFGDGAQNFRYYNFGNEMKDVTPNERDAKVIDIEALPAPKGKDTDIHP